MGGRIRWLGALLLCLAVTDGLLAQQQPPEYFEIDNSTDDVILVYLKPWGRGSKNLGKWQQPISVEPGTPAMIPLSGFEPFDITIREANSGKAYVFDRVELCTMMRECAKRGRKDWTVEGHEWQRAIVNGQYTDIDTQRSAEFGLKAKADRVKIQYGHKATSYKPNEFPGRRPPPKTPKGGPKR